MRALSAFSKPTAPRGVFVYPAPPGEARCASTFPLVSTMMVAGNEKPGEYMLQHYGVEKAFRHLNASPLLTLEQKAGLEFAFLEALAQPWDRHSSSYGIPNLERYVEAHPEMFVQALAWAYKRKDGALDPAKFQAPQDRAKDLVERGYKLLEAIERIPGYDDLGELQLDRLAKWITPYAGPVPN